MIYSQLYTILYVVCKILLTTFYLFSGKCLESDLRLMELEAFKQQALEKVHVCYGSLLLGCIAFTISVSPNMFFAHIISNKSILLFTRGVIVLLTRKLFDSVGRSFEVLLEKEVIFWQSWWWYGICGKCSLMRIAFSN
jgi:hypothetical protein